MTERPVEDDGDHLADPDEAGPLTHEALIRAWPQLRAWIDADRASLPNRRQQSGLEPSPELLGIHRRVLSHDPRLLGAHTRGPLVGTPRPALLPPDVVCFTDRERELAYLDAVLTDANPACAVVCACRSRPCRVRPPLPMRAG